MDDEPGVGWRFLRQKWNRPPLMSNWAPSGFISNTIQISREFTMSVIRALRSVVVGEPVEDVQGHLEAHVLVGVVDAVEQDLGLVLVDADVVADLGRPQLPALVALADGEQVDDVRVRGGDRMDLRDHLGVGVVALPARREFLGREGGRRGERPAR